MPHKVEILSPVGGPQSLRSAVEHGADAIYVGVGKFNARRRAENFTLKELREAVEDAHNNGVRVYSAFNILIKNHELHEFFNTIAEAYARGIDGILIQHISFARLLKDTFPDLKIILSTQAGITNTYYLDLLSGADRVTLPREFSLDQVRDFVAKVGTQLETEVFVHGALCFSSSGQCLFSSFLGGRSGNRGLCAQPCRKKYNNRYLLSTKDLCLAPKIPELITAGISSLKIEGRLRSPRYTALATRVYRLAVDSYYAGHFMLPEKELKELTLEFNREFTLGYLFNETEIIAPESPANRGLFLGVVGADTTLTLHEPLAVGDGIGIWTEDGIEGAVITKIEKGGDSVSSARAGETIKLFIHADEGDRIYKTSSRKKLRYVPVNPRPKIEPPRRVKLWVAIPKSEAAESEGMEILAKVYSCEDAEGALKAGATTVFYSVFAHDFPESHASPYVPRMLSDSDTADAITKVHEDGSDAVLLGDLGLISHLSKPGSRTVYLDYSANIFNDIDMRFIKKYGAVPVVSPELNRAELSTFKNKNFAVLVHGRSVLMNTKYPLKEASLKDERGFIFPVRREFKYTQILNSLPIGLFNEIHKLLDAGITKFFFDLTDGTAAKILAVYRGILRGKTAKKSVRRYHTHGHFNRGVA
jgi:collagenase-like PrtC family protease